MAEKVDSTPQNNHLIRNKNIVLPKYKSHICSHIALKRYCCCILVQIIFRSEGRVIERECFRLGPMHLVGYG
jgi:hypothetical protein